MSTVMTSVRDEVLIARNPATGAELGRVPATPPEQVAEVVAKAQRAQVAWSAAGWRWRRAVLEHWRRLRSREADAWGEVSGSEMGKPRIEAMGGDVLSTLDAIRWTARHGGPALARRRIGPAWQRWLLMPGGVIRWVPHGVVGMLGTWN